MKSAPFFGANQFANAVAVLNVAGSTYDDNQKATKVHYRLAFPLTEPQRFFLPLLVGSTDTTSRKLALKKRCFRRLLSLLL